MRGEGKGRGEGRKCGASGANLLATACVCGRGLKVSGYLRDNTGRGWGWGKWGGASEVVGYPPAVYPLQRSESGLI